MLLHHFYLFFKVTITTKGQTILCEQLLMLGTFSFYVDEDAGDSEGGSHVTCVGLLFFFKPRFMVIL